MKLPLPPLKPRALSVRAIPDAAPDLSRVLDLPADRRALGIITATSDDALFTALDQGTKASPAEVVYTKSFYAGAGNASGPLSGECIGIYAARDPAEIDAALAACLNYLETEAWFYAVGLAGAAEPVAIYPHVVASVGRHLAGLADVRVGRPIAYLIAPPLESIVGLDAACKAARVRVTKWFGPPTETNFGGAYLTGDLPACEAAARAFADAIVDVCRSPLRADPRARTAEPAVETNAPQPVADGRFQALATGERFAVKPDHLTHLRDDESLVPKTDPRIIARGKLDLLQSSLLDAQVVADADGARALVGELGELLELSRTLVGAEVTGRPVPPPVLWGMTGVQIRDATHHTHETYGVPFMYPDVRQGPVVAKLALARAIAREAEVAILAAFPPAGGLPTAPPARADLAEALNRISSGLYLLAVRYVAGVYGEGTRPRGPVRGWKPPARESP